MQTRSLSVLMIYNGLVLLVIHKPHGAA